MHSCCCVCEDLGPLCLGVLVRSKLASALRFFRFFRDCRLGFCRNSCGFHVRKRTVLESSLKDLGVGRKIWVILWSHVLKRAIVSYTSNVFQNEVGNYLSLHIRAGVRVLHLCAFSQFFGFRLWHLNPGCYLHTISPAPESTDLVN